MTSTLRAARVPALTLAVVLTVASLGYGFHRDELYFRMLPAAWGYVDQPPFSPWLARTLTGWVDQTWMLRLPATLASVVAVVLVAAITAELGGDERAQRVAAWGAAFAGFPLLLGHVLLTSTIDHPVTLGVVLAVLVAVRRDPRWWVAAGLLAGLATYNRLLVPFVVLGLLVGLAAFGPRGSFRTPWPWLGALVGAVVSLPNLVWQAQHDWPQRAMGQALSDNNASEVRLLVPLVLVVAVGPFLLRTLWAGVRHTWRTPDLRWVLVTAAVMVLFTVVSGAQPHYPVTMLVVLFAVGCTATDRLASRRALVSNAAISAVIGLPLLPPVLLGHTPIPAMNIVAADQVGWPAYVDQVAAGWELVDDPGAVVFTSNYGEAGAVARFGPGLGLPAPYSGHNALGHLAPPPDSARAAVVVGGALEALRPAFETCEVVERLDNGVGVDNEEEGQPVAVCTGMQEPWSELWPRLRHLD